MADMKKGARVTRATRDKLAAEIKKKYEKGASIRAIAESTGRSYGFVHRVLRESGVELRGTRAPRARADSSTSKTTAKRLLDEIAPERLGEAIALLRGLAAGGPDEPQPQRVFRSLGAGHADHDLGAKAKEIARQELGGGKKSA